MDSETRKRRQNLKVILSESLMVFAVIVTVVILVLLVSGYGINSDFEVERQGMLQIYSSPTGASVAVDGEAPWYQRTNTSKVLSASSHDIQLTSEGYDSWNKTITISEGLLYRLHYPRLFLLERQAEPVYDVADTTFATISKDRKSLLLTNDTTIWTLLELDHTEPRATALDLSDIMPSASIISAEWSQNNNRVLLKTSASTAEWVLVNINNPAESVNLTREFTVKFDEIRIFDGSASNLLAIQGGNLVKIDVSGKRISDTIAENVASYDFNGNEVVYVSDGTISLVKIGDSTPTTIAVDQPPTRVFLSRFYEDKYITIITDSVVTILNRSNLTKVYEHALDFAPETIKIGASGDFVFIKNDTRVATIDMEALTMRSWNLSLDYGWLDNHMLYEITNGTLSVYDFDGLNHRELSSGVSTGFPVTITGDKYLYYLAGDQLTREVIIK